MMRELSFGARIADSFVKKLKYETAKATDACPGVLPCLCVEERERHESFEADKGQSKRIDIGEAPEIPAVNRLVPPTPSRVMVIRERAWVLRFLRFDKRKPPAEAIFEIDDVELHISARVQAELKGSMIQVVNDKIVVMYDRI
jgi:hypothetical protein